MSDEKLENPRLETDDSLYNGTKGLHCLARAKLARIWYYDPRLKDTSYKHITSNLLCRPVTYLALVEGNASLLEETEIKTMGRGAIQDLRALVIYLELIEQNTGFFLAETSRKEGFYSNFYKERISSKLYIAKAKKALKNRIGGTLWA